MFIYHRETESMKKGVIFEVYDFLRQRGLARTESEFSTEWLGQCESYFRGLRFKGAEPTLGVVAICGSRLFKASEFIRQSPRHAHIADQFLAHSERCQLLVNEGAIELDLI